MVDALTPAYTAPPTPWVPLAAPPQAGWERAVDGGGQFFTNNFPAITGVQRALYTRPNDSNALAGGVKGAINGASYQYLTRQGLRADNWLKQKFPSYGEFSNRHPWISGALSFGLIVPLAWAGADLISDNSLVSGLANRLGIGGKRLAESNAVGRSALRGWRGIASVLRHPVVQIGVLVALVGLFVGSLVKGAKDSNRFQQAYLKTRELYPQTQVDPATLRASIVSVLNNPPAAYPPSVPFSVTA